MVNKFTPPIYLAKYNPNNPHFSHLIKYLPGYQTCKNSIHTYLFVDFDRSYWTESLRKFWKFRCSGIWIEFVDFDKDLEVFTTGRDKGFYFDKGTESCIYYSPRIKKKIRSKVKKKKTCEFFSNTTSHDGISVHTILTTNHFQILPKYFLRCFIDEILIFQ